MQEGSINLESLPVSAVIVDKTGTIVDANAQWRESGRLNGLALINSGVGASYLAYCGPDRDGLDIAEDLSAVLGRQRDLVAHVYPCESSDGRRWYVLLAFPLSFPGGGGAAILHVDISGLLPLPEFTASAQGQDVSRHFAAAAMSAVIEASASTALSSQLQSMVLGATKSPRRTKAASKAPDGDMLRSRLSRRQLQVLQLMGEGKSNREIAEALFRSPHTVKLHVSAILKQLEVRSRTQAALLASKLSKQF